jgi:hypothetical protein
MTEKEDKQRQNHNTTEKNKTMNNRALAKTHMLASGTQFLVAEYSQTSIHRTPVHMSPCSA